MKVFVLGSYGKVGVPAIKLLAQSDLVTEIAVAGRNLERAEKAAAEVGEKAVAVCVDGTDEQALASLLTGYDVVANAAYNDTVLPAIRAAITTGTHYCDVAWGNALEPALRLAPEAENAGVTSIVATGISPCISNLMGVHVARQLEEVEQLQIGRADIMNFQSGRELTPRQWFEDPKESFLALHEFRSYMTWMFQRLQKNGSRNVRLCQNGRWVEHDPITHGLDVPLAGGGVFHNFPYFSGDDFFGMLPRDLSAVSPVEMQFSPFPPQLGPVLREQAVRVLGEQIDADTAIGTFFDTIERDPHRWLTLPENFSSIPKWWIRAVGRKDGRAAQCSSWFTPPMWGVGGYYLTSVALVVAVFKILRGEIRARGVMHAENAFEPVSFLDETASLLPGLAPDEKMIDESFEWLG